MLSAFCLCSSATNTYPRFVKKRFLALASGYWPTIIINILLTALTVLILGYSILPSLSLNPKNIIINVLLLNGLTLDWNIMNGVVMGGWYIGAMFLMYLLFPLMKKVYFIENETWLKYRYIVFPTAIFIACKAIMICTGIGQARYCEWSSAKYFSIINQLPSFALGFSLYDISTRGIKAPFVKFAALTLSGLAIFHINGRISHLVAPEIVCLATICLFMWLRQKGITNTQGRQTVRAISRLGDQSFAIYLSHFWVIAIFAAIFKSFCSQVNTTTIYVVTLPFLLAAIYYVALGYNTCIESSRKAMFHIFGLNR